MAARGRGTHRDTRWIRTALALALTGSLLAACTSGDDTAATSTTGPTPGTDGTGPTTDPGDGNVTNGNGTSGDATFVGAASIRLSEGAAQATAAEGVAVVDGAALDDGAVTDVLSRLPEWDPDGAPTEVFNWPTESLPAPRTGATVESPFPVDDTSDAPEVPTGPLEVLRHQPDGDVDIAPFATITFNQPMVPVGTVGQLASADVPATITPAIEGTWQWIGTRTLRFDAVSDDIDRLPMATTYTVDVPARTESATGGLLADAFSFEFSTPPAIVRDLQPVGDDLPLSPVFVAGFDQRVDRDAVLGAITVTADGDERQMRPATDAEVAGDELASTLTSRLDPSRWIAFVPVEPFPTDAAISIEVGRGTPSAEGPRTTENAVEFDARTYPPFRYETIRCAWGPDCEPPTSLEVVMGNEIDAQAFDPSSIVVEPALVGQRIGVYSNIVSIEGASQGRTTYRVTLPASLTDIHGQTLGEDRTVEITTAEAAPSLRPFTQYVTTLDPFDISPSIGVVTVNHPELLLSVWAVDVEDFASYGEATLESMERDASFDAPPGWTQVVDRQTVDVDERADATVETQLELSDVLADGRRSLVVLVEPTDRNSDDDWSNRPTATWVQSTDLGLDAVTDATQLRSWVTDLRTGAPVDGAVVRLVGQADQATTDADGVAMLALPIDESAALVATTGVDEAILASGAYGGAWSRSARQDTARWFVFDDRHVYRPGETVSLKGWVRRLTTATDGQLALPGASSTVDFQALDAYGNVIAEGTADLGPLGGFDLTFAIPAAANLGAASVQLDLKGEGGIGWGSYQHQYDIEEFRRPEFEVAARQESVGPYVVGSPLTLAVDANYYSGGPLGASEVNWNVTTSAATYSPPGWDEFTFGRWTPWWYATDVYGPYDSGVYDSVCCGSPSSGGEVETYAGTTDSTGTHYLQVDVGVEDEDLTEGPLTVSAQAAVTDVDRQQLAATTTALVHSSSLYVGLVGDRTFVRPGEPLVIGSIVTDIDGAAVPGRPFTVTAARVASVFRNGSWVDDDVDVQTCDITSAVDAVDCTFATTIGGTYRISAVIADDQGRSNRSELTRWVSGGDPVPTRSVEEQELTLVPDRQSYEPGDSAEILVQSPITPAHGLMTIARNGIVSTTAFEIVDGAALLSVPIGDRDLPGFDLQLEVVGTTLRTGPDGVEIADAPPQPAFATGSLALAVSLASRTLDVSVTPAADAVEPGDETSVDVVVTRPDGSPAVGADLAVVVVDEAVLAVSRTEVGDPLAAFYSQLPNALSTWFSRGSIALAAADDLDSSRGDLDEAAPEDTASPASANGASDGAAPAATVPASPDSAKDSTAVAADGTPIEVRTDFDALAVFAPDVTTDADGHATIAVPLPDNLTRYRVMVVAAAGVEQFGKAESNITARLPLMVRPSAPRFLNFGDTAELPVVVQNQTDAAMDVDVVMQTSNLSITGAADGAPIGVRVSVPANDRVEVRFPVGAASAGTARFRVAAVSGSAADAATVDLPVYTPTTAEAFATYGVVDEGATVQPVIAPIDVLPQFGGLEITTSSTSLQTLTDAVVYLTEYPYRTSDALASRILAIAALADVLEAFDAAEVPPPDELKATMAADVDALVAIQNGDGGFPYWDRGDESVPFNSVQATHALVLAEANGTPVPQITLDSALAYVADIESHIPSDYPESARHSLSAYALSVRAVAGDRDSVKAQGLYDEHRDDLGLDGLAWLWPAIDDSRTADAIEAAIENAAVDTAAAVTFTTDASDGDVLTLRSDRRTDGIVLDALIRERPDSDLIPKVVAGLLANRDAGRWDSVQENSFILLALHRYFETFEVQTPDFVARVWLGERFAGDQPFQGRSTDRVRIDVPTAELIAGGDADLVIAKEGTGRLYYRIGLRTAPSDLDLDPLDRGFEVARTYEAVDDPGDVTQDADGTWHVEAGARVRVRLTMVAESQRTHAALVDPLPAGLEILNPALATTPAIPADTAGGEGDVPAEYTDSSRSMSDWSYGWWPTWFDHQNLRDDRAEAFATWLPAGTYDYSYVARATTPGSFVVPPTRAEEMYAPETFGRTSTDRMIVDG